MTYPTIRRTPTRRDNRALLVGCTVMIALGLVVCLLGVILLLPRLSGIGLQLAGFEQSGSTDRIFAAPAAMPSIELQNAASPAQVEIDAGRYGTFDLSGGNVEVGSTDGARAATVTFTESQLLALCYGRSVICGGGDGRIRQVVVDLRPGGAVVNGEFYVSQLAVWQRAGIVLKLDTNRAQFSVVGVDLNGTLYSVPPGDLSESVNRVAEVGNELLREVALRAGGESFDLTEIYANDSVLVLVLR